MIVEVWVERQDLPQRQSIGWVTIMLGQSGYHGPIGPPIRVGMWHRRDPETLVWEEHKHAALDEKWRFAQAVMHA